MTAVLAGVLGAELQVLFWVSLAFVGLVSLFWPWWKTDLGWTIILKTLGIAMLLLAYNLHVLFGIREDTAGWLWLSVLAVALVIAVVIWRLVVLWVIQRFNPPPTKSGRTVYGNARYRWKHRRERRA